jgi:hypothetical protein
VRQDQRAPLLTALERAQATAYPGEYVGQESFMRADQQLAGNLTCRFEQAHLPPLPEGRFKVVFLLEMMLAFPGW